MDFKKLQKDLEREDGKDDMSMAAVWSTFKAGTTSHGLPHLLNAKGWFKRLLWLLSTLVCVVGLAYNYYQLATKYMAFNVSVAVKMQNAKSVDFPAVTVCNNNPIKKSALPALTGISSIMDSYQEDLKNNCNSSDFVTSTVQTTTTPTTTPSGTNTLTSNISYYSTTPYYDYFYNTSNVDYSGCIPSSGVRDDSGNEQRSDFIFQSQFLESMSVLSDNEKKFFGHHLFPLVHDCNFAGAACDNKDFETFFNNYHGNCYVFNSQMFNSQKNKVRVSRNSGQRFGLNLLFNLEQSEYIGDLTKSAGLRVVIHDPTRMPFPEDEGILVPPNTLTNIGITLTEVTKLDGVYGDCYDEEKTPGGMSTIYQKRYNSSYTQKSCIHTCLFGKIKEICDCLSIRYPMPKLENITMEPCQSNNQTQMDCQHDVWEMYEEEELSCTKLCTPPCKERLFTPVISNQFWPSQEYKESMLNAGPLKSIAQEIKYYESNDYGMVNVYIRDFMYTSITESPAYEWQDFVSDIGGILGLYIGFSILTIVEFVELFIDITRLFAMKAFCSRKSNSGNKNSNNNNQPPPTKSPEKIAWEKELMSYNVSTPSLGAPSARTAKVLPADDVLSK